ncbi:Protein-L-isoaspartate O-methyltransferase [hydrothermal vent metagenome]|uniref:protein-L-isoaspartate(D-aspartate) O-methyltransferase n=1 Tax=hydrothermal vent metagenome TaxID=652676 RepID=A0A3B1DB61_9ZZZZ
MDYEELRRLLVETQLIPRGIRDQHVLKAMLKVPRHLFVDEPLQYKAYDDMALPIGDGQTISQPYMVAVMTELLELKGNERVLEVGTGSGYQAAILAELAAEVYSIERMERLALRARERLRNSGYDNVHIITGDGTAGLPEKAPFDRIIITAGTPQIPEPLREQLADNGILVAPVGARFSQQLLKLRKEKGKITEEYHTPCVFVPLVGEYGWKE